MSTNIGGNALDQYFNKSLTKGGAKQSGFWPFNGGDQQDQQQGGKKMVRHISPSKKPAKKGGVQQEQDQQGGKMHRRSSPKKIVRRVSPSKKVVAPKKAVSKK